jgi:hypothetical protein
MRYILTVGVLALWFSIPGWAAGYVVDNLADYDDGSWTYPDPGNVTLRKAIRWCNYNGIPSDTITFAVSGTISLDPALGPLWIGNEGGTTIDASGQDIVIDASNVANAFQIASNGNTITAGTGTLKIQGAQQDGIYIAGSNNVIDGVEITETSSGSTYYAAITISGGDSNEVKNCDIHDNDGYGIIVANGATNTQIHYNEIHENGHAHAGNFAPSGIIVENDGTDGTVIEYNDIYNNDGNGIYILGGATNGPADTLIQDNDIYNNGVASTAGVGILVQGAVEGDYSVDIYENDIHNNYAQGVLIEAGNGGSPTHVGVEYNKIYSNGQEGVLIRDSGTDYNIVEGNLIGTDDDSGTWPTVKPNKNSGVAITNGAQHNTISDNTICYNRYQNVLISGSGTDYNIVEYNWILGGTYANPPVGYNNTGVIIINGAKHNEIGPCNAIQYHYYDGIQIVGDGTDYNEIIGNNEWWCESWPPAGISYNGRGIAVLNEYPEEEFDYDLQLGSSTSGPAGTLIQENSVTDNNGDGILLRYIAPRSEGVTTIFDNTITDNGATDEDIGNGIYCIGSSPDITDNTITGNHENGIKLEVYFGTSDSPSTYDDDVLSDGPSMTISGNFIGGNGTVVTGNDIGAGIYAVDTPLGNISDLYTNNEWEDDDDVCHIQQDWYGYVRAVDQGGNPVTGRTVVIEQGGDAAGWNWIYTSAVSDADGNYGPAGFGIDHARSYFQIVEKRVRNDGVTEVYTPQLVYFQGETQKERYSFNGRYPDPAGEPGGAIESPTGSGWDRYQYAQLTISCNVHDLNGDCVLDIVDVRIAYKIAMGCIYPTPEQRAAADVDGDGDVDMDDVRRYAEWVLGGE